MAAGRPPKYTRPLARVGLAEAAEQLGDDSVEAGQALRDASAIEVADEGGGLWVGRHADGETEVQLTGRKLKDYRCDCGAFAKTEECAHLAAVIAAVVLRKRSQRRAPEAAKPARQVVSTRRLLQSVHEDDLRAFVQAYAKTHPDFALDLKLRFAESLPLSNRFEQVVKALLKRDGKTYSPRQAKRISLALRQFAEQRERYLAERTWLDLYELNTTLAPRLAVVLAKAERVSVDLPAYVSALVDELATLARSSPPPVLLERLDAWLDGQLERGAYFRFDLDGALYRLAAALGREPEAVLALVDAADERYGPSESRLRARMDAYYEAGEPERAEALLIDHLDRPGLVFAALQSEVALGNVARATRLAEAAYPRLPEPADRVRLARFLLQSVDRDPSSLPLYLRYAPPVVLAQAGLDEIDALLRGLDDETVEERVLRAVLAAVERDGEQARQLRPEQRERLRAELLARLGEASALEELLYRTHHASIVREFVPRAVGQLAEEDFKLLLETKVREYLDNRFGQGPGRYVAELLDDTARRARTDVVGDLVTKLRRDYRDRPALMGALTAALL